MNAAGFTDVRYVGKTGIKTSQYTVGAHFTAVKSAE
jgi:hypothetical protein